MSVQSGAQTLTITKVAVLGAGVMGQGIAAHLANAGVPSVLFDIVPRDLPAGAPRSKLALDGIANVTKLKPAALYRAADVSLITAANYEDDAAKLGECDLVIEVVVENLKIKHKVFEWVAANRKPGSVVASNTSGLQLAAMAAPMPEDMRKNFIVMHFFNPVRYMRLLELVTGPETDMAVAGVVARFGERVLGKGIVWAKDTPNFVANRIGTFGILSVFHHMGRLGLGVDEVDAIFGSPMGRPSSAVFRTGDLVGLDTLDHVLGNVYDGAPDDEQRERFQSPPWLKQMIAEGAVGEKAGRGFYKKGTDATGARVILTRDLATGEYGPQKKVRFPSLGQAKGVDSTADKVRILVNAQDAAGQLAWACTADTLIYAANRLPEIADDIVNIDRGMCWGFGWETGPFETWDVIGVASSVARMEADGLSVPAWVKAMLAAGRERFYQRDAQGRMTAWDPIKGESFLVPMAPEWLMLDEVRARPGTVTRSNDSASLVDLGDGIACLQFHAKMNAIDDGIIGLYEQALDELEAGRWEGLVVGNQGGNAFCAGANLFMIGVAAGQGLWGELTGMVEKLQTVLQRAKYASRPVVTAPRGLTLGGGCEIAMQSAATVAGAELYMGLVEVGVGLIPAGGGCKEMLARALGDVIEGTEYDPNPFVQNVFRNMALAKVSMSAEEARGMGYLRATDKLVLDPDALIHEAKRMALGLAQSGYKAPRKRRFKLPGASGRAAIELFLYQMHEGGYATDHDVTVSKKLAWVLTGGDVPAGTWLGEDQIIELEREAFLSLAGMEKTQERIQHMLMKGKPLRN